MARGDLIQLTVPPAALSIPNVGAGLPGLILASSVAFSAGGEGGGGLLEQEPLGTPPGGPPSVSYCHAKESLATLSANATAHGTA
jgi:hypothetical protein